MKTGFYRIFGITILLSCAFTALATERYVSPAGAHVAPFTDWAGAATNIQEAIDAAEAGDVIWVTNGIYATGGRVADGTLTNRVVLDKALTVQSVNGADLTIIQGAWDPAINGPAAVRCAWLTNGALLSGFTLRDGATRERGVPQLTDTRGAGVWGSSMSARVDRCLITHNAASDAGGGAFQVSLTNCRLTGNVASGSNGNGSGGGAAYCQLQNCAVTSNMAWNGGGGALGSTLVNCTVSRNYCGYALPPGYGGGVSRSTLTNCIVSGNWLENSTTGPNHYLSTFSYSCTTPLPAGTGNLGVDPRLLPDNIHLAEDSPCRGAGSLAAAQGSDLDEQAWNSPPSMGCDEWQPTPLSILPAAIRAIGQPGDLWFVGAAAGQNPLRWAWLKDGVLLESGPKYTFGDTANLIVHALSPSDAGDYQPVVSNAAGVVTGAVTRLVVRCVDVAGSGPVVPYGTWATAATNIQDAIDAAAAGDVVLVTNGVYASGSRVMDGNLPNRIALDRPLIVMSANGPELTIIQGAWDPATNGPAAVRCAWLTNGAVLAGFTLRGGATREDADGLGLLDGQGGGAVGTSTNATLQNCRLVNNAASRWGGGANGLALIHCTLLGNVVFGNLTTSIGWGGGASGCLLANCVVSRNSALGSWMSSGGGVWSSVVLNSTLTGNYAIANGGGARESTLINCTVTGNAVGADSPGEGGGVSSCQCVNSIVWANFDLNKPEDYSSSSLSYCCSTPLPTGTGNIATNPGLLSDGIHLAATSPCRGAGTSTGASGTDIDGQPWNGSPSMGCDEWLPEPVLILPPAVLAGGRTGDLWLPSAAAGQSPFSWAWLKDGVLLENGTKYTSADTTNLVVHGFSPVDAGEYQVIVSNAVGVVTSAVTRVAVHCVDAAGLQPVPPYSAWAAAATTLQDAVEAAGWGDVVLVTNGVYAAGGKAMFGNLTNRVAIDKPLAVLAVNGPANTVIQGAWDPATTNGPLAVRCVWMAPDSSLNGFTIQGGATRATETPSAQLRSGGGVWGNPSSLVANCIIATNCAAFEGGGAYSVMLSRCRLFGNSAMFGGGAAGSSLFDCFVQGNSAPHGGGGADGNPRLYGVSIANCTIIANSSLSQGAGVTGNVTTKVINSIVYNNINPIPTPYMRNIYGCTVSYCCTFAVGATHSITADPQLLDGAHLAVTSPCRGAGSAAYATGTDLDGEPWANPPSIGCDEVWEDALVGPLKVSATVTPTEIAQTGSALLQGAIDGRASRVAWDFGDGTVLTNASSMSPTHAWTNTGDYTVTFTAFNADNPTGVSTDLVVHVVPLLPPAMAAGTFSTNTFSLSFDSQIGVSYLVEQTTNLAPPTVWSRVWSGVGTGGPLTATDTKATNEMRFYRVRTQ